MSATRGPRTGRIPPHIQERVDHERARAAARATRRPWYSRPLFAVVLGLLLLAIGFVLGRLTSPAPQQQAIQRTESFLTPVFQETTSGGRPVDSLLA